MALLSLLVSILSLTCILFTSSIEGSHKFRYKGWGWTPNIPALKPEIPGGIPSYVDPRLVTSECIVTMKNATFNLLPLHLNPEHKGQLKYYTVKDVRSEDDPNDDYKYAFNVCGPVLEIPPGCGPTDPTIKDSTYCEDNNLDENGTCREPYKQVGDDAVFAYQMKIDANEDVSACWHLSDKDGGPGVWSLINEDNPSEGVSVSYLDGDYDSFCGHNREINIRFVCDNDHGAFGIPGEARSEMLYSLDQAQETEMCQYKLEFHTVYGCPAQCPIVGNKLCNGVGLCGYDKTREAPRCYCYSLFTGDSCTEIDVFSIFTPKHDPVTADPSSPYVEQFDHILEGPSKKQHHVTVTYDLGEFPTDPNRPYIMRDIDGKTHTYVWNFMNEIDFNINISNTSNLTLKDYGCDKYTGYCADLNGTCAEDELVKEGGYIYQIDVANKECVVAGGKKVIWSLYDEDNPARGVVLKYQNGDYCPVTEYANGEPTLIKKNRQFTITLLCPDDSNTYLPLSEETQRIFDAYVEEDDFSGYNDEYGVCNYHVTITSAFACPDECVTDATNTPDIPNDVSVCSAQGMCAADPFSTYVHCLCDDGWTGDYCDEPYVEPPMQWKYKNQGSYIAAIIIISVILIGICYFGYKKINSQKEKVKELEIKLVNYQSSGGAATFHDERPPQIDEMPQSKGPSLSDKIKNKFGGNKRGKYANISSQNDDEDDEEELFNVKVKMNGGHSDDDDEENDDDAEYNKPKRADYQIGDDEEDNSDNDNDDDDDDEEEEDDK